MALVIDEPWSYFALGFFALWFGHIVWGIFK